MESIVAVELKLLCPRWPSIKAKSIPIPFFENEWIGLICLIAALAPKGTVQLNQSISLIIKEMRLGGVLFLRSSRLALFSSGSWVLFGWVKGAAAPRQPAQRRDERRREAKERARRQKQELSLFSLSWIGCLFSHEMKWNEEKQAMEKRRTNQLTAPRGPTPRGKPKQNTKQFLSLRLGMESQQRNGVVVLLRRVCWFGLVSSLCGL